MSGYLSDTSDTDGDHNADVSIDIGSDTANFRQTDGELYRQHGRWEQNAFKNRVYNRHTLYVNNCSCCDDYGRSLMLEYIYTWIENITFYMVIMVAVLHMVPGETYKKYIDEKSNNLKFSFSLILKALLKKSAASVAAA